MVDHGITLPYRIAIPSRRRPDSAARQVARFPDATVYVAEGEREDYERYIQPGNIRTHRERGMGAIRNHILDDTPRELAVVMIDDDLERLVCHVGARTRRVPEARLRGIIEQLIVAVVDLDVSLGGFGSFHNPKFYPQLLPFSLTAAPLGIVVHNGRKIRYDPALDVQYEDLDATLQALSTSRVVWVDNRFACVAGYLKNAGGLQGVRTGERMAACRDRLEHKWGKHIDVRSSPRSSKGGTPGAKIKVKRRR